jgi:hypothetical protein
VKLAVLVLLAACGGGGGDWSARKVAPVTGTFNGKAFTIELPQGMTQTPSKYEVTFDFREDGRVHTPSVTVSDSAGWKTLDDYVKSETKVSTWVRKDTLPNGFIAAHENTAYPGREDYVVYSVIDGWGCMVRVTPWKKGDSVKDKLPAAEQMCLSLKPAK